jgi:hypothetical protein
MAQYFNQGAKLANKSFGEVTERSGEVDDDIFKVETPPFEGER